MIPLFRRAQAPPEGLGYAPSVQDIHGRIILVGQNEPPVVIPTPQPENENDDL